MVVIAHENVEKPLLNDVSSTFACIDPFQLSFALRSYTSSHINFEGRKTSFLVVKGISPDPRTNLESFWDHGSCEEIHSHCWGQEILLLIAIESHNE